MWHVDVVCRRTGTASGVFHCSFSTKNLIKKHHKCFMVIILTKNLNLIKIMLRTHYEE